MINGGLGVAIGLGLWAIGMPNPLVWGVAAALLNFLPYVGALMTILLVAAIALIVRQPLLCHAGAGLRDASATSSRARSITPLVVGRRLEINAVAIFIAVAFWSWLWGFVGALIAVPLLVVIKVFCDHFDGLRHVGNFLSAQQVAEPEEPEPAPPNKAVS